jgi:hypothetical protein
MHIPYTLLNTPITNTSTNNITQPILPPPVNTMNNHNNDELIHKDNDIFSKYRPDDEPYCNYDCCDILLCSCVINYFL